MKSRRDAAYLCIPEKDLFSKKQASPPSSLTTTVSQDLLRVQHVECDCANSLSVNLKDFVVKEALFTVH